MTETMQVSPVGRSLGFRAEAVRLGRRGRHPPKPRDRRFREADVAKPPRGRTKVGFSGPPNAAPSGRESLNHNLLRSLTQMNYGVIAGRLNLLKGSARLFWEALSPRRRQFAESRLPSPTRLGLVWRVPPWMESRWIAGVPLGVEELECLRSEWLLANPDRRAEFAHGSYQAVGQ
jgi:hypothetical protein